MTPIVVQGMQGLGDCIYQRAVLRELTRAADLYLETPWPQLYSDLPIRCVRPPTTSGAWRLRTQTKNLHRTATAIWYVPPAAAQHRRVHYANRNGTTMLHGLCDAAGVHAKTLTFDLPTFADASLRAPYIVIRPATIRTEWKSDSRNPRPEYLALAAEKLRRHFRIISVADLAAGAEWALPPLPYADETFHAGELGVEQLLALVENAAGVVGGVGWLVPAAIAYQVPMFLLYGGQGANNGPARIFDPRMKTDLVYQVRPDRFCMCAVSSHACDKRIGSVEAQLGNWIVQLASSDRTIQQPRALAAIA